MTDWKRWFKDHNGIRFMNGCHEEYNARIDDLYAAFKARFIEDMELNDNEKPSYPCKECRERGEECLCYAR